MKDGSGIIWVACVKGRPVCKTGTCLISSCRSHTFGEDAFGTLDRSADIPPQSRSGNLIRLPVLVRYVTPTPASFTPALSTVLQMSPLHLDVFSGNSIYQTRSGPDADGLQ